MTSDLVEWSHCHVNAIMAFFCDRRTISLQRVHQLFTDLPHLSYHHVKLELENLHFSGSLQVLGLFAFLIPSTFFHFGTNEADTVHKG